MFRHRNACRSTWINSIIILIVLLFLGFILRPVQASPDAVYYITVDTLTDHVADYDKYACTSDPNDCSLRGAIRFANATAAGSEIHISIPAGTYYCMRPNVGGIPEDLNETGDLDIIGRTIYFEGAGRDQTIIDGQTLDRVLHNYNGGIVTIEHLSITQGVVPAGNYGGGGIINYANMTLNDVLIENNSAEGSGQYIDNGGGISNHGTLTILNSSIIDNEACNGGGVNGDNSRLTISNSTIADNHVRSDAYCGTGGGVATYGGSQMLNLSSLIVEGNTAKYGGGVFYNGSNPDDVIRDSIIRQNTASIGGAGVYNYGTITLNRITLTGNQATSSGGGLLNMKTMTLNNTTIQGNSASFGGGVDNSMNATLSLDHCTVADNTASVNGTALFTDTNAIEYSHNTVLAGGSTNDACVIIGSSIFNDQGYNLSSDDSCSLSVVLYDLINTDPLLGTLGDNGGLTPTMALLAGSPAIDMADPNLTLESDQRGYYRPVDGNGDGTSVADIGAFEYASYLQYLFWLPLTVKAP